MIYKVLNYTLLVCATIAVYSIPIDNPSEWPGHLQPFGSNQITIDIEDVLYEWPSPNDFFRNYIDKTKPVLLKGVYKYSTAVRAWTDDYLVRHPDSKTIDVSEEPSVIENRTVTFRKVSFYEFIHTYHKKPILTFATIPKYLMTDVAIPSPIKCNETRKELVNAMLNINQGGAKSLVYSDDVETIYCAFRGTVDFLLIEYTQNKNYVIDRPEGGYATIDVQRVDYVKYPDLRKVNRYIKTQLTPGDCLYIPYKWYKQYNSHANYLGQSISLNVWFKHLHDHYPKECSIPDDDATLDKFTFSDTVEDMLNDEALLNMSARLDGARLNGAKAKNADSDYEGIDEEEHTENEYPLLHFQHYVKAYKRNLTISQFYHIVKKDGTLTQQNHSGLTFPKSFQVLVKQLFKKLDTDEDKFLSNVDFQLIEKDLKIKIKMEKYLQYQIARIEDYVEDLIESKHHDESIHAFDKRKMEEIKSTRAFDEL